jgi:hypothetical protein
MFTVDVWTAASHADHSIKLASYDSKMHGAIAQWRLRMK